MGFWHLPLFVLKPAAKEVSDFNGETLLVVVLQLNVQVWILDDLRPTRHCWYYVTGPLLEKMASISNTVITMLTATPEIKETRCPLKDKMKWILNYYAPHAHTHTLSLSLSQSHTHTHTHTHTCIHTHTHTTNTGISGDGSVEWEGRKWWISMQKRRGGHSVST